MVSVFTGSLQSKWILDNKLLQKYPRLLCLEYRSQCKSLKQLNQILSYVLVSGLHRNHFVMSRVLYSCLFGLEHEDDGKLKRSYATRIFSQIRNPNSFTWNTMIRAFATSDATDFVSAFHYYKEMLHCRIFPDSFTYTFLLQACGANLDVGLMKQVHCHAVMFAYATNLFVQNSLIHSYFNVGSVPDGRKLFDEMTERDVVSWTTLISGLVNQEYYVEGFLVFNKMMADESVCSNVATMVSVMSACANFGSLDHAREFHAYLEKMGWVEGDVSIRNSLIDVYSKCGNIDSASRIFYEMHCFQRDAYSWTAMIAGLAMHGCGMKAVELFLQMKQVVGVVPDAITFIAVLSACAHAGLVDEGMEIFESMKVEYGILPELQHFGCMVDLFGRAGLLEHAYRCLESMPMKPRLATLGSLLSACRLHNNVELGEIVLQKINATCENVGGACVLLSNMYASEKQWSDVVHVRKGLGEGGNEKRKPPGKSWIEVKGVVHEFVVRDKSDSASELDTVLDSLGKLLFKH